MNTIMKTYIYIETDFEDGIQIPIIVTAENNQEAEQKILSVYFDRYEKDSYQDPKELQEAKREFLNGGFPYLEEEIVDNFIVFTTDKELIYCDVPNTDYLKVWEKFHNL